MKWKNPVIELPHDKQLIWVAIQHWKKSEPCSWEIYGAEYNEKHNEAWSVDEIGEGWRRWPFPKDEDDRGTNHASAWLPAESFKIET